MEHPQCNACGLTYIPDDANQHHCADCRAEINERDQAEQDARANGCDHAPLRADNGMIGRIYGLVYQCDDCGKRFKRVLWNGRNGWDEVY